MDNKLSKFSGNLSRYDNQKLAKIDIKFIKKPRKNPFKIPNNPKISSHTLTKNSQQEVKSKIIQIQNQIYRKPGKSIKKHSELNLNPESKNSFIAQMEKTQKLPKFKQEIQVSKNLNKVEIKNILISGLNENSINETEKNFNISILSDSFFANENELKSNSESPVNIRKSIRRNETLSSLETNSHRESKIKVMNGDNSSICLDGIKEDRYVKINLKLDETINFIDESFKNEKKNNFREPASQKTEKKICLLKKTSEKKFGKILKNTKKRVSCKAYELKKNFKDRASLFCVKSDENKKFQVVGNKFNSINPVKNPFLRLRSVTCAKSINNNKIKNN